MKIDPKDAALIVAWLIAAAVTFWFVAQLLRRIDLSQIGPPGRGLLSFMHPRTDA